MKITIAQLNPIVGDIDGNLKKVVNTLSRCSRDYPDLVVFPELFLTGYPPRDLLERAWFIKETQKAIQKLMQISVKYSQIGILLGVPCPTKKTRGNGLYNSAILIYRGKILMKQHKSLLPTYDVFDEARYFDSVSEVDVAVFKGEKLGISICEDMWNDPKLWWPKKKIYTFDPIKALAKKGATIFINISASPFHVGKEKVRYNLIRTHAKKYKTPFIYVNQVGANDELIFDGRSMSFDRNGELIAVCSSFEEQIQTVDTITSGIPKSFVPQEKIESVYKALVLGIRDYMRKCNFSMAVIGLSGGVDSAITCCLAQKALGGKNVLAISMPSPYSSKGSIEDSIKLVKNLGIQFKTVPISEVYYSYLKTLKENFKGKKPDTTEENIQARVRGNILMAFSNKFGHLVLSTGNKSELAMGYCTLYGDMSGGLGVLSDVPKTMVYEIAHYINRKSEIIPKEIIEKPPSAELKFNQKDQDTLPPYDILDQILYYYIDECYSIENIIKLGFIPKTVKWVIQTVNKNEYKRRQAAPGLRVTTKAFGMGRRMPIAAKLAFGKLK